MRNSILAVILVLTSFKLFGQIKAQPDATACAITKLVTPTASIVGYVESERGANHKVWQKITAETDGRGLVTYATNIAYVELASGLHYRDAKGEWQESKEVIESYPGGAVARQGAHQVIFAKDLAEAGSIDMQTAEGQRLRSQVLGLFYLDRSTGKVAPLAWVKSCTGVITSNQVIYANAFDTVKADVRYTYTRAGLEQDVILREQLPPPESFGLNPETTRLTVLTEFLDAPTAMIAYSGDANAEDQQIDFGGTRLGFGRAFSLGGDNNQQSERNHAAPVIKKWFNQNGRKCLFEEVDLLRIRQQLDALPIRTASVRQKSSTMVAQADKFPLPPQRKVSRKKSDPMQVVSATSLESAALNKAHKTEGFVLDYTTVGSSLTNFTFQSDTTYYITGPVSLVGTNYFEGGTVIKFTNNVVSGAAELQLASGCKAIFQTGAYRPAVFTAKDDNTVGETISGSSGTPSGYYGGAAIYFTYADLPIDVHDARFPFVFVGVSAASGPAQVLVRDCQFTHNSTAVYSPLPSTYRNLLIYDCGNIAVQSWGLATINVEHVTISATTRGFEYGTFNVTNSLFVGVNLLASTNYSIVLNPVNCATNTSLTNVFQTVGAGAHYLQAGSPYRNAGSTNVSAEILADLKTKTTYPPIDYSNVTFNADLTLAPQAQRDTDTPDLGYHYPPLDYLLYQTIVTNSSVVLTGGVAVANYPGSGLYDWNGGGISSQGTVTMPNWVAGCNCVQEQSVNLGTGGGAPLNAYASPASVGDFQFTKFTSLAGNSGYHLYHATLWSFNTLKVQNCEFYGAWNFMGGNTNTSLAMLNNLMARTKFQATGSTSYTNSLMYSNNLNYQAVVRFGSQASSNNWSVFNNAFDGCAPASTVQYAVNGYNAYYNCTFRLYPTNGTDLVSTNNSTYNSGTLGDYYQPTNSVLINAGSTNANLVGLYHYTTMTNQVKETNTVVDIGYHYVAVDANGIPLDTDGDGLPDYIEDTNGNGANDFTDLANWLSADTDGDGRIDQQFRVVILSPR